MKKIEANSKQLYGYVGKILHINLTDSTTEIIPTSKYVPHYVGGRTVCHRIYWDLVKKPNIKAYDPENTLVFMTGPTQGTGIPSSGHASMTGIGAHNFPEQYVHGTCGGFFNAMLKWAGYDGFILEGKAPRHTYIFIQDDKVEFLDADFLWGKYIHETQDAIEEVHGDGVQSLVIGPAGENLHRNSIITNNSDSCFSRCGFGAVWGSKNLKAISVRGTGDVHVADIKKILDLRMKIGLPSMKPVPLKTEYTHGVYENAFEVEGGYKTAKLCCSQGCNRNCMVTYFEMDDPLNKGEKVAHVSKCVAKIAFNYANDHGYSFSQNLHSKRQELTGVFTTNENHYSGPVINDEHDPDLPLLHTSYKGDVMNLYGPSMENGNIMMYLCTQYGLDKWDMITWFFTWLGAAKKEGLLDDIDFGMEPDPNDPEFVKHFIQSMVYREGIGDIFAEGMARAIRKLGKEKYGDTIYSGRLSRVNGKQLDIPVSFETIWGMGPHHSGRGFQGCPKWGWVIYSLNSMSDSRDTSKVHWHEWTDAAKQFLDDPCHSEKLMEAAIRNEQLADLKDSVVSCEWRTPTIAWPEQEREMFVAATGLNDVTTADLYNMATASKLMYRAILIRNHNRTRDMEVEEAYPFLTYPDPWGEVVNWYEWNDAIDLYYKTHEWDVATGWPTRSLLEKYDLGFIADEMEKLGKLPPEGRRYYERKPNPFNR